MNDKVKRYLIGSVIPVLLTVLVCGIIFKQNAAAAIFAESAEEEAEIPEGTVILNKGNWEEYFEYVEEYVKITNDAGEVERVELDAYYRMKREYYERLDSVSGQVILMADVDDTFKEYKITDPKTGEWELTGNDSKYESGFYEFMVPGKGHDRDMCFWYSDTNRCDINGDLFYQDYQGEMVIQVINELEIRAVEGQLTFK